MSTHEYTAKVKFTRPWQPGDTAVTDAYSQGRTAITLVEKEHPGDCHYWLVKPGDGKPYQLLYEDEFRRPEPDTKRFGPASVDCKPLHRVPGEPIWPDLFSPEPAPKREWKRGDRVRTGNGEVFYLVCPHSYKKLSWWAATKTADLLGVAYLVNVDSVILEPEQVREPAIQDPRGPSPIRDVMGYLADQERRIAQAVCGAAKKRFDLVADLKRGGIDAVRKHLPAILEQLGIARDEADAIMAQIKKGEFMGRFGGLMVGLARWQEAQEERTATARIADGIVEAWLTGYPAARTKRVKFLLPCSPDDAVAVLDSAWRDPRNDGVYDGHSLTHGLTPEALSKLHADVLAFDACD